MLDFHIKMDGESRGNHTAAQHNYAGGIDYDEFAFWQDNQIFQDYIDYYKDFTLSSEEVVQKLTLSLLISEKISLPRHFALIGILQKAQGRRAGLMAYAD